MAVPGSVSQVVALVKGNTLVVANAGDSRCVCSRDGTAIAMTADHKPTDKEELARISKASSASLIRLGFAHQRGFLKSTGNWNYCEVLPMCARLQQQSEKVHQGSSQLRLGFGQQFWPQQIRLAKQSCFGCSDKTGSHSKSNKLFNSTSQRINISSSNAPFLCSSVLMEKE